jgi:hypothetical protein
MPEIYLVRRKRNYLNLKKISQQFGNFVFYLSLSNRAGNFNLTLCKPFYLATDLVHS